MAELPTGTVTFLFTDIAGSTKLLRELGDEYADVLAEHRRILRDAFAAHDGVEVDTQGDGFFVAFARATDAAAAAGDAQRGLAEGRVRVRMGIHTGEPIRTDEGYAGMDVHRAARIAAVGHGGQVLVSQTSRDLLDEHVELRDLGAHRLKDLTQAQRIYQLGDEDFPQLKSLQRTNLPVAATALVGREQELTELCRLLGNGTRLVTLTGAGGSGKTRLALQVAAELSDDFGDGVFFVPLAPVQDAELVGATIAQAVGLRELSELREAEVLLVLDNMEHLLASAGVVSSLLGDARTVKLLATSRAPLRVTGEHEYALDPLRQDEAVELFLERARSAKREVTYDEAIPEICRRLDGLPLAVELAASRVKVLDPPLLLERLERRLPLLTGGARDAPERQQTLRATIEWSYELLEEPLQRALRRLSVFAGTFSLEAAESVTKTDLDEIAKLIDWSLVKPIGEGRFFMLETIREYALERLEEGGELGELRRKHLDYFLGLAEREQDDAERGTSASLERLESDHGNLRAALQSARELDDPTVELRLVSALSRFWEFRGHLREGLDRSRGALERGAEASPEIASAVFWRAAMLAIKLGEYDIARQLAENKRRLASEAGDERQMGEALNIFGVIEYSEGRYEEARELLESGKSLRGRSGDQAGVQAGHHNLGLLAMSEGDYERARAKLGEALAMAQTLDMEGPVANSLADLGFAELGGGRLKQARARFEEALAAALGMGWKENVAYCLVGLAATDVAGDELDRAARLLGQVDRIAEEIHLIFQPYAEAVRSGVEEGLRSGLEQDRFDALRAEGRSQTIEEAVGKAPPA
jgi:predicted ATPase/class 3 adenylate cyclase/Tfp pilus assembly protein PilF